MLSKKKIISIALAVLIICVVTVIAAVYVSTNLLHNPPSGNPNLKVLKFVSTSMEPTIMQGSYILYDTNITASGLNADYPNSDIIVFHRPTDPTELIVHRIAAKEVVDGKISFYTKGDGNPVNKWPNAIQPSEYDPWGAVSQDLIVGKVVNTNYKWP